MEEKPVDPQNSKNPEKKGPFKGPFKGGFKGPKKGGFKGPKKGGFKGGKKGGFKGGKKGPTNRKRIKIADPEAVKAIIENYKVSFALAAKVTSGKITIEEAVNQQKINEEIKQKAKLLCEEYKEISFSAAFKLIQDNIKPEDYLAKKQQKKDKILALELQKKVRMQQDASQSPAYQALEEYVNQATFLELAQYKGKLLKGKIRDFTPYTFNFVSDDKETIIHRLALKYFYNEENSAMIQKWIIVDKAIQKKQLKPKYKPVDRFQFPEGVLQKGAEIMLALHEGEMIRGVIEWFTPYDIMLKINGKCPLWVLRHSVIECALLRRPKAEV